VTSRPAIAVVVPFFQSGQHIRACIESLLHQVGVEGELEIIFVDNGSTDQSAAIVAGYQSLTLLRETTPGAYAARNTGISRATAPIIAFTDADCVVDRDWVRAIQDGLRSPSTAVLIGHCRYPPNASVALRLLGAYENAKADYVTRRGRPTQRYAYANNMAVRASVFEQLGPFKTWARAGDSELVHRLASGRSDLRVVYSDAVRVTHLEFVSARARAGRLALYSHTNSQIATFEELGVRHRLGIAAHLLCRLLRR
jgi:glycosyltransferase involved in cell wall biosynthesis